MPEKSVGRLKLSHGFRYAGPVGRDEIAPRPTVVRTERSDLRQREAGTLAAPDDKRLVDGVLVVDPLPRGRPGRDQHTHVLPVPQHVGVDADDRRGLTDAQTGHVRALLGLRVLSGSCLQVDLKK